MPLPHPPRPNPLSEDRNNGFSLKSPIRPGVNMTCEPSLKECFGVDLDVVSKSDDSAGIFVETRPSGALSALCPDPAIVARAVSEPARAEDTSWTILTLGFVSLAPDKDAGGDGGGDKTAGGGIYTIWFHFTSNGTLSQRNPHLVSSSSFVRNLTKSTTHPLSFVTQATSLSASTLNR